MASNQLLFHHILRKVIQIKATENF